MSERTGAAGTRVQLSAASVAALLGAHGARLVGVLSLVHAEEALAAEREHLREWQRRGYAGEMRYMQRGADLLTTVRHLLPAARSVISFAVSYLSAAKASAKPAAHCGRIARYAWGQDYHRVLRTMAEAFVRDVEERYGLRPQVRMFTDAVPLLERALAVRARLGFIGKNTLLIRPPVGSYAFLGEILWDLDVEKGQSAVEPPGGCGSCARCLSRCPTAALVEERVLDARRCISYLTIEKRGVFTDWERRAIGSWLFGCDECQEVCPFNAAAKEQSAPAEFIGAQSLALAEVLALRSDAEFEARFRGSALLRAGREGLLRNACAVSVNNGYLDGTDLLLNAAQNDPSPIVREEARRALAEFAKVESGPKRRNILRIIEKEA